jgi:hypothetical protein
VITNKKLYDVLKAIALIWLPASGTLYVGLAAIWGLPASEQVSGTVLAVDTFLGVVLGLSTAKYNQIDSPKYVGTLVRNPEHAETAYSLNIDLPLDELIQKKEAIFRVVGS